MPPLKLTPEIEERLSRLAGEHGCSPERFLRSILDSADAESHLRRDPLVAFTLSPEFRTKFSDAERYLAILAWAAEHHPAEFRDLIEHADSGRRYLGLNPEQIRETCRHNQARQIPGTHFWAIMNLDTSTKRRFLRRLLIFVGARDEVVEHVTSLLGRRKTA